MLITLARKPLNGATVVQNCLQHGCGALNIDASRIGTSEEDRKQMLKMSEGFVGRKWGRPEMANYGYEASMPSKTLSEPSLGGRFPANVLLVPTPDVLAGFPVTTSGTGNKNTSNKNNGQSIFKGVGRGEGLGFGGDTGSASRFFKKINKETP